MQTLYRYANIQWKHPKQNVNSENTKHPGWSIKEEPKYKRVILFWHYTRRRGSYRNEVVFIKVDTTVHIHKAFPNIL